ncbi:MAG TPA: hypothetical protein VGF16_17490 [Bryobacteraceae bacterium]|jgi:hypothetical protein
MASDELRTAFEWELVRASELESQGESASAIQTLQNFWDSHRTEDHDGWLHSAVLFHQGSIRKDSGDLTGALNAFRTVNASPADRPFYLLAAYCLAKTLDELGEEQQAFDELTRCLSEAGGTPGRDELSVVTVYLDLAARLGQDIPPHHRDLVGEVVRTWEIPLTESESRNPASLQAAVTAANERLREFAAIERSRNSR